MTRTSDILERFVHTATAERISLGALIAALGDRAFGLMIILLVLPNLIPGPTIPGYSLVFGAVIALLAQQMLRGFPGPSLPVWFLKRSVARKHLARLVDWSLPWLRRLERHVAERPGMLTSPAADRWLPLLFLLLAIALALPLPFGNTPPALALIVLSVGLLERDSRMLMIGVAAGILSLLYVGGLLVLAITAADVVFGTMIDWLDRLGLDF
jgi:hypothetical protein